MNIQSPSIKTLQTVVEEKDYGTLAISVIAVIFGLFEYFTVSFASGFIAILYRVLICSIRKRRVDKVYKSLYGVITDLKKNVRTQREIRLNDLQEWSPKTPENILKVCWKRLQEEEVILKDDRRWVIGNRTETEFHFILAGA